MQKKGQDMAKDKICGIYKIENITNGKMYIGSSQDIDGRWKVHRRMLNKNNHHSPHLQAAWNKYGCENFTFSVIEECAQEVLLDREQYYIDYYDSADSYFGYNTNPYAGRPCMTDEQRAYYGKLASKRLQGEGSWCNIYSETQILELIDDLKTGEYSYVQLSKKHNISYDTIASVARHASWAYLTEEIIFPKAKSDTRENVKLTNEDVNTIISLLLNGECNKNIAELYNVHPKTISDIRHHKTWTDLTVGMNFPRSPKTKAYDKSIEQAVKQLRSELKLTYEEIAKQLNISKSYVAALNNR